MLRQFLAKNSFWLSLFLHLLVLFLLMALFWQQPPRLEKKEKTPHYYVPAYTYTGSIKPTPSHLAQPHLSPHLIATQNTLHISKNRTHLPTKKGPVQKSMLLASLNMLEQDQLNEINHTREPEPIYLIGDDNAPADPLIKLMGRSLSAHFHYPQTAGELGIKGKVLIGLTLHPGGDYSDVELLRSSSNQDLDAAALYAVNTAPLVVGANRYLTKPRHFVVGFVFY